MSGQRSGREGTHACFDDKPRDSLVAARPRRRVPASARRQHQRERARRPPGARRRGELAAPPPRRARRDAADDEHRRAVGARARGRRAQTRAARRRRHAPRPRQPRRPPTRGGTPARRPREQRRPEPRHPDRPPSGDRARRRRQQPAARPDCRGERRRALPGRRGGERRLPRARPRRVPRDELGRPRRRSRSRSRNARTLPPPLLRDRERRRGRGGDAEPALRRQPPALQLRRAGRPSRRPRRRPARPRHDRGHEPRVAGGDDGSPAPRHPPWAARRSHVEGEPGPDLDRRPVSGRRRLDGPRPGFRGADGRAGGPQPGGPVPMSAVAEAVATPPVAARAERALADSGLAWLAAFAAAALGAGLGRAVTTSYLPLLLDEIKDAPGLIGTAMLVNAAAGFVVPLVIGLWSDRRGRRMPFVVGGSLVAAGGAAAVALGSGSSYLLLAASGAVVYVGLNAVTTAHRALVPESFAADGRARATSAQELALLVGSLAGVVAGGALTGLATWAPFAFAAVAMPLLALPTAARVREGGSRVAVSRERRPAGYYLRAAARPGVGAFLVAQILWVLGYALFSALIPVGEAGGYTALYFSVRAISSAVALPVGGWAIAATDSYRVLFLLGGTVTLAALAPLARIPAPTRIGIAAPFRLPSRRWWLRGAAALAGVFATIAAAGQLVMTTSLSRLDEGAFRLVNELGYGPDLLWDALNPHTRNYVLLNLVAFAAAAVTRPRLLPHVAALLTLSWLLAWGLLKGVYALYDRPRPAEVIDPSAIVLERGWTWAQLESFPSGHMAITAALAGAIGLAFPRLRTLLWAYMAAVAFTRVLFGAHFPADVIVGIALGYASARLAHSFLYEMTAQSTRSESRTGRNELASPS